MLDGPRFFRYAVRLAAYTGVLAARVAAEQREQDGTPGTPVAARRGGAARPAQNDPHLVAKLSGEGWLEHNVEKG